MWAIRSPHTRSRLVIMGFGIRLHRRGARALAKFMSSAVLLSAIASCNPIETYRHWTGISANDPNPETTPNTKNLAAGDAKSYPNLATVPPPPSRALTTAELDKLTQSLIADRANAKYTSEHLQAQFDEAAAAPPPPPLPATAVAQPAPPAAAAPGSPPPGAGPASSAPAAAPAGPTGSSPTAPGGGATSAPSAMAAPAAKSAGKPGQPPEPGPMESSLQSPQIASLPQPQQNQAAPAAPHELSVPAGSANANATAPGAHLPPPPAPEPMPAAIGSAQYEPPPPPPKLASVAPTVGAAASPAGKPPKPAPSPPPFAKVADIAFSGDATMLSDADRQALDKVVQHYRTKPGLVRVVGYAGIAASATEQLNSYRTALDRAQAVAKGLAQAGIPANKIAVEAAPSGADSGLGRAEILFEQ
jgi:outer membrane protein OmpA-like peptidoglycan-associated protein